MPSRYRAHEWSRFYLSLMKYERAQLIVEDAPPGFVMVYFKTDEIRYKTQDALGMGIVPDPTVDVRGPLNRSRKGKS